MFDIKPTSLQFKEAEESIISVINSYCPTVITKNGSAIRELLVRPAAYIQAWFTAIFEQLKAATDMLTLMASQATLNETADAIASNFFVTRKLGTSSKGMLTLTINVQNAYLPQGSQFTVSDTTVLTTKSLLIGSTAADDSENTISQIPIPVGTQYLVTVPVECVETGDIEIEPTDDVTPQFTTSFIDKAELTSALTGGTETLTDAEMLTRAKYVTAFGGVGSYNGIRKKLQDCDVAVLGLSVLAGLDSYLFRSRYNNTGINPGGFTDAYVKTQNQMSTKGLTLEVVDGTSGDKLINVNSSDVAGFYRVVSVLVGGVYVDFTVTYGSSDSLTPAKGARLSPKQTAVISYTSALPAVLSATTAYVTFEYMPGIYEVNEFMSKDENKFIGQDILVKAAVPVSLSLHCDLVDALTVSDDTQAGIKQCIADYVNSLEVGTQTLNFSDIASVVRTNYPDIVIKLPCVMGSKFYTTDGSIDTAASNTGLVKLLTQADPSLWDFHICFFSLLTSNIRLG